MSRYRFHFMLFRGWIFLFISCLLFIHLALLATASAQSADELDTDEIAEESTSIKLDTVKPDTVKPDAKTKQKATAVRGNAKGATNRFRPFSRTSVEVSYVSWMESALIHRGVATDLASSSFVGNGLTIEHQFFRSRRLTYSIFAHVLQGEASVGGSQTNLPYHVSHQSWLGAALSPQLTYRLSPRIETSFGPMVLTRSLDLPVLGSTSAESGSSVNWGLVGNIKMFLWPSWFVRFEMGGLMIHASTIWSLGVGYRF